VSYLKGVHEADSFQELASYVSDETHFEGMEIVFLHKIEETWPKLRKYLLAGSAKLLIVPSYHANVVPEVEPSVYSNALIV